MKRKRAVSRGRESSKHNGSKGGGVVGNEVEEVTTGQITSISAAVVRI